MINKILEKKLETTVFFGADIVLSSCDRLRYRNWNFEWENIWTYTPPRPGTQNERSQHSATCCVECNANLVSSHPKATRQKLAAHLVSTVEVGRSAAGFLGT